MEIARTFIIMQLFILSWNCSFSKALFVEETSHFRLSCPEVSNTQIIVVNYRNNSNETIAFFTHSECNVSRGDIRCFKLDNMIGTLNVVEIEVTNQTRTIVSYSCGVGAVSNITFYVRPSNISCQPPALDDSGTKVLVTCTIGKVYPQPGCVFYDTRNESIVAGTKLPVKYVPWGSPVYYKAECAIEIEVPEEDQVYIEIHVNVYPEIFNINGAMYGVNYTVAPPVIIEPLNVTIDPRCPKGNSVSDGYIKAWTSATCKCLKTSSSAALGRAFWYEDNQQVTAGVADSSSSELSVSYPNDLDKTYQCKGSPLSSDQNDITFTPKFAFGPQNIVSDVTQITIDLCSKESKSITINVWVPKRDVSPDVRVKAAVELIVKSSTSRNEAYDVSVRTNDNATSPNITSTLYLTVTSGGKYVVTATFINTIFSDLSSGTNISVTVREPPTQPPIFIINGGESIIEGITTSNVNLTCYAPGGYPEVSEISISCVGRSTTKSGNKLTVKMDFDKLDNGSICTCQATHSSGCFNNSMVSAIVNITYIVNITSFTANNQTQLEVKEGQPVTLSCSAESYPQPVFFIDMSDSRSNEVVLLTSESSEMKANIWRCKYTLPSVKCEDVKNYTCRATHIHSNITVEKNVFLSVTCPFHVTNSSMVQQQVGVVLGQDLALTVDVVGNPPPTTYELLRGLNKSPVENGSFHVTFTPLNHPYGILKLTLFNVQREDLTLFSLVVDNSMQENMTYSFLVFENTGNEGPDIAAIVGGVLGGVIFIIMVIIGLFMYRNRCRKPTIQVQAENGENESVEHALNEQLHTLDEEMEHEEDSYEQPEQHDNNSIGQSHEVEGCREEHIDDNCNGMEIGEDGSAAQDVIGQDPNLFGQSNVDAGDQNENDINEELTSIIIPIQEYEDGSMEHIQGEERDLPDEEVQPLNDFLENEEEVEQDDNNSIAQPDVLSVDRNEADRHYVNSKNRFESLQHIIPSADNEYIEPVSTSYFQDDNFEEGEHSKDDADSGVVDIQDDNTDVKELHQSELDHLNSLESNSTLVNSEPPDSFNSKDGPGTLTEDQLKDASVQKNNLIPIDPTIHAGLMPSNPSSLSSVQENSISGTFSSFNQSINSDKQLDITIAQDRNYSLANHKTLDDFLRPGSFGSLESIQTHKNFQQQVASDEIMSLYPIDQNNIAGLMPSNPSSLNSDQENDISGSFKGLIPENPSSLDSIEEEPVYNDTV